VVSEDGNLSMLPMLAAMRGRIGQLKRNGDWSGDDPACVYDVLAASISQAIDSAAPISDRDIAFWTGEPDAPILYRGLQRFFASIGRRCPPRDAAALADVLLRKSQRIPHRMSVRGAARLRRILGARLAGTATAHWMRWKGR
jgi:hypothetical protein